MNVYRVDGKTGAVTVVADGINAPNGLCFTPDEKKIYIVESRSEPRRILVYDVAAGGDKISNGKILIDSGPQARRTACVAISTAIYGAAGACRRTRRRARVHPARRADRPHQPPERCANLCSAAKSATACFMAAAHSLYSLYVNTQGVAGG